MKTPAIHRPLITDAFIDEEPAPVVANVHIRFLYSYMLHMWSIENIRNFFSRLPLDIDGKRVTEIEFFRLIWNIDKTIPQVYISRVHKALELYLLEINSSWEEFFLEGARQGVSLVSKTTLWLISRFLNDLMEEDDLGTALLKALPLMTNHICAHSCLMIDRFSHIDDGELCCRYLFTFDRCFNHDIPPDEWFFHYHYIKDLPARFGGKTFKNCRIILEVCTVFDILNGYEIVTVRDGILFVGNERFGHIVSFHDYLLLLDVQLCDLAPPARDIILIEKNYYCHIRKRDVLHKGVAYGAPLGIFEIFHTPENINLSSILSDIINAVIFTPNGVVEKIDEKHKQVLNQISCPFPIIYRKLQAHIFFNGKIITSGTQARLIYEILRIALVEKRSTFYRRELAQRPEFIINKFSNGLSVRLTRALEIMKVFAPFIVIEKTDKGLFTIFINSECVLIEQ